MYHTLSLYRAIDEPRALCVLPKYSVFSIGPQTRLGTTVLHEEAHNDILFVVSGNHTGRGQVLMTLFDHPLEFAEQNL